MYQLILDGKDAGVFSTWKEAVARGMEKKATNIETRLVAEQPPVQTGSESGLEEFDAAAGRPAGKRK